MGRGYSIAGTHTTSATSTLLFWNLLHNPDTMGRCVDEIRSKLPDLGSNKVAYSVTEVEASLPFLRQCVRENFRITPVFTMPLPRRVVAPEGVIIAGEHIEQGVGHNPVCDMLSGTNMLLRPQSQFVTMPSTTTQKSGESTTTYSTRTDGNSQRMRSEPGTSCILVLEGGNASARQ